MAEAYALDPEPGAAARTVCGLFAKRTTAGEIQDVQGMLPPPTR